MMVVVEAEKQSLPRNLHTQFHPENIAIKTPGGFQVAHPDSNVTGTLDSHCMPPSTMRTTQARFARILADPRSGAVRGDFASHSH